MFGHKNKPSVHAEKCILVVEDNLVDQKIILKALQMGGFRYLIAYNGQEGLDLALNAKPDLILLDCEMPVMDGPTMCRKLKEHDQTANIPVVFLTAVDTPSNIIDCFEMEASNYLQKPISPNLLCAQIEQVFNEISSA